MRLRALLLLLLPLTPAPALAQDEPWPVARTAADLAQPDPEAAFWADVPVLEAHLVGQPMVRPRPQQTTTAALAVQAVHDGTWLALRLVWTDDEPSEAGRLGLYSDGAAVQFPMTPAESPPPIFMGVQGMPVHIFHWRAQYQRDAERGKPTMRDLYPNLSIDMYPMEFADPGRVEASLAAREQYSPGHAVGNPQSYAKSGVDEIWAEGFSTSSVQESVASGHGIWKDGRWSLVIVRPLQRPGGSSFAPGDSTFVAFAIWQGGAGEVGSRKSVTMTWTPLRFATTAAGAAAAP
jgi:hypothetical protein